MQSSPRQSKTTTTERLREPFYDKLLREAADGVGRRMARYRMFRIGNPSDKKRLTRHEWDRRNGTGTFREISKLNNGIR
jgi:hypothetical protein